MWVLNISYGFVQIVYAARVMFVSLPQRNTLTCEQLKTHGTLAGWRCPRASSDALRCRLQVEVGSIRILQRALLLYGEQ